MSVIEDTRKVMPDFLAPELRAISASLDALQKRYKTLDHKIEEVDRRAEKRAAEVEQRAEKRLTELGQRTDKRFDAMEKRFDAVDQRFAEAKRESDKRHDEIMAAFRFAADIAALQTRSYEAMVEIARLKERQDRQERIPPSESASGQSSAA
jgi:hypothetical protein